MRARIKFATMATSGESDPSKRSLVSQVLGNPDETRKMLVANIAANIFESLKSSSDMKGILKDLLLSEDKNKRLENRFENRHILVGPP